MLLLFGINTTEHVLATPTHRCGRCGQSAPHDVLELVRKFTFFFVPVFRLGGARYVDVCTVCGLQTVLTQAQATTTHQEPVGPQDAPTPSPQDAT